MSKSRRKPIKVETPKPEMAMVEFTKDFEGQLNNWIIKAKKGDILEILPFKAEWLKKFGVI